MNVFIDYKLMFCKKNLPSEEICLGWAAFLESLELRSVLFQELSSFEESQIYKLIVSILQTPVDKDLIIRLYDELFAQVLTEVKSIPQIDPLFLLEKIQEKKDGLFGEPLKVYENLFKNATYPVLHDLTLYLAWDRMCVYLGTLFDHPDSLQGLDVLKDCLIESFFHITKQKKCAPSFFRLMETLYSYFLREENINTHSKEDWDILSQSSLVLRSRKELIDVPYIDEGFFNSSSKKAWTSDSKDHAQVAISLGNFIMNKIKKDNPDSELVLTPLSIDFFSFSE